MQVDDKRMEDKIILRGMRENNLKDVDLDLPKERLIVFCGLSGSGKSSLVFDTIAREGQRQMTRNYSQYLRRHMTLYERPKADLIENLSPVLVIDQRPIGRSSQSTVGSYMEAGPLLRLLFSRLGDPSLGEASDFSASSSLAQCPTCSGNGKVIQPDVNKLVDMDKSINEYAVAFKPLSPAGWQGRWMATGGIFDPDLAIKDYPEDKLKLFLYGPEDADYVIMPFHTKDGPHQSKWDGLLPRFKRLYIDRDISNLKEVNEEDVLAVSSYQDCPDCQGTGINPKILEAKVQGYNIAQMARMEIPDLIQVLAGIEDPLGQSITSQLLDMLESLVNLGLGYLNLARRVDSLSGGESQRLKIARQLISSLNNMTYIFDEPSSGLHASEVSRLIKTLKDLRYRHNNVILVDHHPLIIQEADMIVELGPGAGDEGGRIIYQGRPKGLGEKTPTGQALVQGIQVKSKDASRQAQSYYQIESVSIHNLKDLTLKIPKGVLVCLAGPSGSGKSSLIIDVLYEDNKEGTILVDQRAIGRSSRSTIATYMDVMDAIRAAFAKKTGQDIGLFSFNSLGACLHCQGKGEIQPDMAFADPVTIPCDHCQETRYSDEARAYQYKGKNIVEVLDTTVKEALETFESHKIQEGLASLAEVGLDYVRLGQDTSSLSGGELQRLKLASQLRHTGRTYILDEPSTGLHPLDVDQLLDLFDRLVDKGNTVIVIEHDLKFIARADWVIELGPGGGRDGGQLVFEGRPQDLIQAASLTGKWLAQACKEENN